MLSMEKISTEKLEKYFKNNTKNKCWALMLFNTELELGISNEPGKWVNTNNIFFNNGMSALNAYANTPNPASQLVDAKNVEELQIKMEETIQNFKDNKWLEENLYPYM